MYPLRCLLQSLLGSAFLAHGLVLRFPPVSVATQTNAMLPRWSGQGASAR